MKVIKGFLILTVGMLLGAGSVYALQVDATLTADNHYALYTGAEDGSGLSFIGKSEANDYDSTTGLYSWETPENWSFTVGDSDYIYVVGWSDDNVAQGWIGQFVTSFGTQYSNTADWEFIATGVDRDSGYVWDGTSGSSDTTGLAGFIGAATVGNTWQGVTNSYNNGDAPWGLVSGIDAAADWIWGGTLEPGFNHNEYLVFRTQLSGNEVPEPATMLLMGLGLAGLAGVRSRKTR